MQIENKILLRSGRSGISNTTADDDDDDDDDAEAQGQRFVVDIL